MMGAAEMELNKVHQLLDLANVPQCDGSVNRTQARLGLLFQREADWKRRDLLNHELLSSFEKQLGITPADITGTIGSRIEELTAQVTAARQLVSNWRIVANCLSDADGDRVHREMYHRCASELESALKRPA